MNPSPPELVVAAIASVPPVVVDSVVAIVQATGPVVRQFGTGILLKVADRAFVITAGHVATRAHAMQTSVGITGATDRKFIALTEPFIATVGEHNPYDLAICPLTDSQCARLGFDSFVRLDNAGHVAPDRSFYFVITGFPQIWAAASTSPSEGVKVKALQFGGNNYKGSPIGLKHYSENHHLLLQASEENALNELGTELVFRDRNGMRANFPGDIEGVSGCSVWSIGDLSAPPSEWQHDSARIVGVLTGVYPNARVIKATRWIGVVTLLYLAYPELRPALELHGYTLPPTDPST
jgi:hypothetical protein